MHIASPSKIYFLLLLSLTDSTPSIHPSNKQLIMLLFISLLFFFFFHHRYGFKWWSCNDTLEKIKIKIKAVREHWKSIKIDCVLAAGFFLFSLLNISINCNCINLIVWFESLTRQIHWSTMLISDYIAFFEESSMSVNHPSRLSRSLPFCILFHFHHQLNFHLSLLFYVMSGC